MFTMRCGVIPLMSVLLSGCGLAVPEMEEFYEKPTDEKFFENIIANNIKCELHKGVQETLDHFGNDPSILWLKSWGATVTLKITADEKSSLSPSATVTNILENSVKSFPVGGDVTTAQTSALGLGAQGSADATRVETISFTYAFRDLLAEGRINGPCDHEDGILIRSDLKIA